MICFSDKKNNKNETSTLMHNWMKNYHEKSEKQKFIISLITNIFSSCIVHNFSPIQGKMRILRACLFQQITEKCSLIKNISVSEFFFGGMGIFWGKLCRKVLFRLCKIGCYFNGNRLSRIVHLGHVSVGCCVYK
jgi:hypothetical protein